MPNCTECTDSTLCPEGEELWEQYGKLTVVCRQKIVAVSKGGDGQASRGAWLDMIEAKQKFTEHTA